MENTLSTVSWLFAFTAISLIALIPNSMGYQLSPRRLLGKGLPLVLQIDDNQAVHRNVAPEATLGDLQDLVRIELGLDSDYVVAISYQGQPLMQKEEMLADCGLSAEAEVAAFTKKIRFDLMNGKDAGIFFDQLHRGQIRKFRSSFDGKYKDPSMEGQRWNQEEAEEFLIASWTDGLNAQQTDIRTAQLQRTDENTSPSDYSHSLELRLAPKTLVWVVDYGAGPKSMLEIRIGAHNDLLSAASDPHSAMTFDRVEINVVE